jgi:hypothetical protein
MAVKITTGASRITVKPDRVATAKERIADAERRQARAVREYLLSPSDETKKRLADIDAAIAALRAALGP